MNSSTVVLIAVIILSVLVIGLAFSVQLDFFPAPLESSDQKIKSSAWIELNRALSGGS